MLAGIRSVAVLGAILFGAIWVAVAISPERLERSAVGFVKQQITQEMQARTAGLVDGNVGQGLAALSDRLGLKQDSVAQQIQSDLPELVGEIVSRMCGCDGPSKSEVAAAVRCNTGAGRMANRIRAKGNHRWVPALPRSLRNHVLSGGPCDDARFKSRVISCMFKSQVSFEEF